MQLAQLLPPLLILTTLGYVAYAIVSSCREVRRRSENGSPDSRPPTAKFFLADGNSVTVRQPPHPAVKFFLAGGGPVTVAVLMTAIFYIPCYIKTGWTTLRFTLGTSTYIEGMVESIILFLVFLPVTALSAVGALIWLIACALKIRLRPQIVSASFSILFSALAFATAAFTALCVLAMVP